ncbi:esterase family protein [Terriglobus tenax]|uniref:esterase family protein n=1 Tax=Terriglobus tenax TaxID=1111115 RepID=UPI0021E07B2D|nr:alpha/beta hydrolase-fold protein [Terriglobus tenax]
MNREYHTWLSPALGREMELLVFGHAGIPTLVFPTSQGRFYDFENNGMVQAVQRQIDHGQLQLFCVDSVDSESWYNREAPPRWRIGRHLQYEQYILNEVTPLVRQKNHAPQLTLAGCSFGGFHAASMALRHPETFTGMLSISGAFDLSCLLNGYSDEDSYLLFPTYFLPNLYDPWYLDRYRKNVYVLATGVHDQCWDQNEKLAAVMRQKGIPVRLDVWGDNAGHDWPWWRRMAAQYL